MKNLIISTIAGFIAYFLLGWLFYGIIFTDIHPENPDSSMLNIALGCFFYALLIAYIWCYWANLKDFVSGLKAGVIFGFISSLSTTFFMFSNKEMDMNVFGKELFIMTISTAIIGGVIALVNGKLSK